MKLARIFQDVEETQFLKKLSFQNRLFFIGESKPLTYIKDFFNKYKQIDANFYYDLSVSSLNNLSADILNQNNYQGIVVVSMKYETSLFQKVKAKISQLETTLPVYRLFGDVFINLLCHRKLLQHTSDRLKKPRVSYAVLTTPRSGSTYFCDLLSSTEIAGYPAEHLRLATQELARHCNFNYIRLLHNLMQYRTTSNDVFGTKFISHFLFELRQTKPKFKQIFQSIDKFILLVRQDKIAQAVSLVLAQKTEVWHLQKHTASDRSYQEKLEDIQIDNALLLEVEQKYKFIQNQEKQLRQILDNNHIKALEIVYEDILENPQLQIGKILNFLEITQSQNLVNINSGFKKMPSNISQQIIHQYKQKKALHTS